MPYNWYMSKEYKKFIEEYKGTKYGSVVAEYKRTARYTVKKNINAKEDVIFKTILRSVLKGSDKSQEKSLFEGEKISTKNGTAYTYKFVPNKRFAYIYKSQKTNDYFITTFYIEGTSRAYSIVSYTYESKLDRTIVGFNGMLGNMKFKKQAKVLGTKILESLKNKCEEGQKK